MGEGVYIISRKQVADEQGFSNMCANSSPKFLMATGNNVLTLTDDLPVAEAPVNDGEIVDAACVAAVQQFAELLEQHEEATQWNPKVDQEVRNARSNMNSTFLKFFGRTLGTDKAANAYVNVSEVGGHNLDTLNQRAAKLTKKPAGPLHPPKMKSM